MNKSTMVLVPQSDIDELENARLFLHKLAGNTHIIQEIYIYDISEPMYNITHKRYKTVEV